jgi:hypothetical protein
MAIIRGWRLIRQTPQMIYYFNCSNGQVEYAPNQKYRIEKKNAYDPTLIHRRKPIGKTPSIWKRFLAIRVL